jgi:hypothetical protein
MHDATLPPTDVVAALLSELAERLANASTSHLQAVVTLFGGNVLDGDLQPLVQLCDQLLASRHRWARG